MDNLIYINGTANPEQITSDDIQDMRTDTKFVVNKFKGQQDLVKDLTLPSKYTATFLEDEALPHLYARHYRATFAVPEYPEEEMCLLISLVKGVVTPNITVHVRLSQETLPGEKQEVAEAQDDPKFASEMLEGESWFIKDQLGKKVQELFPYLTTTQVEDVVIVLNAQLAARTSVSDKTFLAFLHRAGIAEDTDVTVFNTMINDVSNALAGLGIDILEPDAKVNWNC